MPTLVGNLARYPARVSVYWYSGFLALGTLALCHPACSRNPDAPIRFLDALFTATSALCVTGLSVRSTPNDFTALGQFVILLLIQTGGIGIMTITTFIMAQMGARGGLREQAIVAETLGATAKTDLGAIVRHVMTVTFVIELMGAMFLYPRFAARLPWDDAMGQSIFHSISAFCNAGFALYDDSITPFVDDWTVNFTLMGLIILGGIGYPVMMDVGRCFHQRGFSKQLWDDLRLHSKLTLLTTGILIAGAPLLSPCWNGTASCEIGVGRNVF